MLLSRQNGEEAWMQKRKAKPKQKYKRRKFHPSKRMYREVESVVGPYGCTMTAFGSNAVGVQGDDRVVGPAVIVRFPTRMPQEKISEISTRVTNEVRGVTRVLMEVEPIREKK